MFHNIINHVTLYEIIIDKFLRIVYAKNITMVLVNLKTLKILLVYYANTKTPIVLSRISFYFYFK